MTLINSKAAGLLRQGQWSTTNYIYNWEILFLNIQSQGTTKQTQATAAGNLNLSAQCTLNQDTPVSAHQPNLTLNHTVSTGDINSLARLIISP